MRNALHYAILALLIAVGTVLTYYGLRIIGPLPVQASAQSVPIDWLLDLEMKLTGFFFAVVMVPIFYSLVVFRRRKGETGDGEHIEGHTGLELVWLIIPLGIVIWLGIVGADNLREVRAVDPKALEIGVIAHQWDWSFEYPPGGFSSDELYLPINQQVVLKMQSLDVIHSFWVVEFQMKQDLVPGRVIDYRVTPTLLGDYLVRCSELCGLRHAKMEKAVHVVTQAVYDKWFAEQKAAYDKQQASGIPDATRGEKLYNQMGCKTCHSLDGSKGIGPTWKGLYNSKVTLANGSTVTADEAYLFESIHDPGAKTVQGFGANAMPNFGLILSDLQIKDLVAFIETIK